MSEEIKDIPIVKKNWIKKPTWRNIGLVIIVFCLYYFARPTKISFLIGGFMVVSGELVRLWAAGYLMKNKKLVVVGPYAYIRDPLYLGSLLILSGLSVAARNWYILAIVLIGFFGFYLPRKIKIETQRLEGIFGDEYVEYRKNVRSIIPRLTPFRDTGEKWEFKQIFHNSEHATGLLVLFAWLAFYFFLR